MKRRTLADRFNQFVVKQQNGCHEWTGYIMPSTGYGQMHANRKTAYTHRVSWELSRGPIQDGLWVLHKCDNRKCVNPDHLFLGTDEENKADMVSKRRQAHGRRNPHAKLQEDEVLKIRDADGPQHRIGDAFGVTQSIVSMIKSRQIWRYI